MEEVMMWVWNMEGVRISTIATVTMGPSTWITGTGLYRESAFQWHALAETNGWFVEIMDTAGKRGSLQGATYNLPLEVASAVRRIL
jgi:deoxyhypusine synthase